jgi:hypothetical protein
MQYGITLLSRIFDQFNLVIISCQFEAVASFDRFVLMFIKVLLELDEFLIPLESFEVHSIPQFISISAPEQN